MKKILSLILLVSFFSVGLSFPAYSENYNMIPANTPITIQAANNYNSNNLKTGDKVFFTVVNDISANGKVVIAAGTPVTAVATKVKARSRIGKPGEINIGEFHTTSVNGLNIPLTGVIMEKAKSKMALSITLSAIIIPFFLLMRGKDVAINQGLKYTVFTTSNTNF